MENFIQYLNIFSGLGAIALQVAVFFIAVSFLFFKKELSGFLDFIKNNCLAIGFWLAFLTVLLSMAYSDVVGFPPCRLCWLQRIFIYPQVVLLGMAFIKKDRKILDYSIVLLIVGFLISISHNYIYYFGEGSAQCDGSGVSCAQKLVSEFGGYISIPMMSLSAFLGLLVVLLVGKYWKKGADN